MRGLREVIPVVGLLLVSACTSPGAKVGTAAVRDVDPKRYTETLERFTASDRVYENFETKILVTATYKSWSFRDAFVDEYARRYVIPRTERAALKDEERKTWEVYHSFVVTAYMPETRDSKLEDKDATWKMRLYDSTGASTTPVIIKRLDQDVQTLPAFFPYMLDWGRTYLVKFPREQLEEKPTKLTLQLSSPDGVAELGYDLTGEPAPERPSLHATIPEKTAEN